VQDHCFFNTIAKEKNMFVPSDLKPSCSFLSAPETEFLARRINAYYRDRVQGTWGGGHLLRGRLPGKDAICLMSNDYLALANHQSILRAQADVLLNEGNGMLMSGVFLNCTSPQREFELRLARFMHAERRTPVCCKASPMKKRLCTWT
jgi:CAI-1 autoinducer synthase